MQKCDGAGGTISRQHGVGERELEESARARERQSARASERENREGHVGSGKGERWECSKESHGKGLGFWI